MLRNANTGFLRCIGFLSFTKDRIKLDSLPTLALALQQNCLKYYLPASRVIKGITVFKIFIWGGISSDIRSEILFNGDASVEP